MVVDSDLISTLSQGSYDDAIKHVLSDEGEVGRPPQEGRKEIFQWWIERMMAPSSGLYERMVWFWHTHLTTNHSSVNADVLISRQLELLRTHALGNFRDLLQGFVIDGALLQYLNGAGSQASNPNENLARELMELFTVGIGNHTEEDIKVAARALAGWVIDKDTKEVQFKHERAFISPIMFRGIQDNFDTAMIVDQLCDDLATASFVSNKLWHHLAGGWLGEHDSIALGKWWQKQDLEILPLVERILRHDKFEETHYSRPRTGVEFYGALRGSLGISTNDINHLRSLGQLMFEPPTVAGWPTDNRWLEPGSMLSRGSLAFGINQKDYYEPMPGDVDHVLDRCGLYQLSPTTMEAFNLVGLNSEMDDQAKAFTRWRLALTCPEFQMT